MIVLYCHQPLAKEHIKCLMPVLTEDNCDVYGFSKICIIIELGYHNHCGSQIDEESHNHTIMQHLPGTETHAQMKGAEVAARCDDQQRDYK